MLSAESTGVKDIAMLRAFVTGYYIGYLPSATKDSACALVPNKLPRIPFATNWRSFVLDIFREAFGTALRAPQLVIAVKREATA